MKKRSGKPDVPTKQLLAKLSIEEILIPEPEVMEKYKALDPRFVPFFLDHGKTEQNNRFIFASKHDQREFKLARGDFWINVLGLSFAFVSTLSCLIIGAFLIYNDKPFPGIGVIILGFYALVKLFLKRNKN